MLEGVENMTYLSTKLKELREKAELTQYQLSEELNIKRSAYGNYETGMSYPEYDVLEKIADYYKVDVRELLDLDDKFEKSLDLKKEAKELEKNIKEYFYKRYRKIPDDKTLEKIIKFVME
jgi:transcriptional regulator with XRE-family HTH domain